MSHLLDITDLHAFYGKSHVLHGVNLYVDRGEIVSLLGRPTPLRPSKLTISPRYTYKFTPCKTCLLP